MMRTSILRKVLLFAVTFLASAMQVTAQKPISNVHNFGKIGLEAPMEHTFYFQNEGSEVLEIENLKLTMPLIVTKMTSRVQPGSSGSVTVHLEKPRLKGKFQGSILVSFKNVGLKPLTFWVVGELAPPIEFEPFAAFFISTQRWEEKTQAIEIINHESEPLEIMSVLHNSSRFTTELKTLEPGRRYELSLTLKPEAPAGRESDIITLVTSSREHPFLEVWANTNINERVYAFPFSIDFEVISVMSLKMRPQLVRSLSLEITVYQKGGTDFQIYSAQTDVPFLRLTMYQAHLKDRYGLQVEVIPEKLESGEVDGSIVIATNDSEFPRLVVPVKAVIEGDW